MPEIPPTPGADRRPCCPTWTSEGHADNCFAHPNAPAYRTAKVCRDDVEVRLASVVALLSGLVVEVRRVRTGLEIRLRLDHEETTAEETPAPTVRNVCSACGRTLSAEQAEEALPRDGRCLECWLAVRPGDYLGR